MEPDDNDNPKKLGKFQSPISPGFTVCGWLNGVVLIFADTQAGGLRSWQTKILFYACGAVVPNRRDRVVTALHCLHYTMEDEREEKEVIIGVRSARLPMQVWAMPAGQFYSLDQGDKENLDRLRRLGAVRATGYYTRCPTTVGEDRITPAVDSAVVEFERPLTVRANQPLILSAAEVENLLAWLMNQDPRGMVDVVVEGTSYYTTPTYNRGPDHALLVEWADSDPGAWTWTKTAGMSIEHFRDQLDQAITFRPEDATCPLTGFPKVGMLRIDNLYVSNGFSGGGTYIRVPAIAINPGASPNSPGVTILIRYCHGIERRQEIRFLRKLLTALDQGVVGWPLQTAQTGI